ncbi:hypothetical protein ASD54_04495 [Rhizobium sp. Root149]|uniref:DUF2306 domain-containing protein n=1 Tax=Rhizobium TaxID=379 RepID=UPI0007163BFA|nr:MULTISPECIES: DUF2306 domain-containing protein [Rhizobium]KQZ54595.1 hypothetical protein ASD54_04495 [Rhizobium sp. Root149]
MMLAPLLEAPLAVQIHVAAVLPAAVLGAFLLIWKGRGTSLHRLFGKIWLFLMLATAGSSFFIHSLDMIWGFSPIHLLSVMVIVSSWRVYRTARAGNIRAHTATVRQLYFWGIVVAGGFTLVPHRMMHAVVVRDSSSTQLALLIFVVAVPLLAFYLQQNRKIRAVAAVDPIRATHHSS